MTRIQLDYNSLTLSRNHHIVNELHMCYDTYLSMAV